MESLTWQKKLSWLVPGRPWGWAGAASLMVVLLLLIGIWTLRVQPSVTEWFLEEHAEYVSEGFDLDIVSSDPKAVDAWFKKNVGLEPEAARFLIAGFEIKGGKKMEFAGLTSALACLKKGEELVSVYAVPTAELAIENLESRRVGEKEVWVGSHQQFNIVVWKDRAKNQTWAAVAALSLEELLVLSETV